MSVPARQIRTHYSADTITVYQAYSPQIALPAVAAGRFVPPFRRDRMTWIKPSFLWMMYRCGWATKPGQERVLSIDITREGFEWALARACLSHYDRDVHGDKATWSRHLKTSPVRVQWDPERSLHLKALPYRSLQVGLSGEAVDRYVDDWILAVNDITPTAYRVRELLRLGDEQAAAAHLPVERVYPLPTHIGAGLDATPDIHRRRDARTAAGTVTDALSVGRPNRSYEWTPLRWASALGLQTGLPNARAGTARH